MKRLGYYNGTFGEMEDIMIPMNDRAGYYGDGVYDATYSRNYKIYALDEHMDRFFNSAAQVQIQIPYSKQEIADLLNELVMKMDTGENLVYWQVSRGTAVRRHTFPDEGVQPNLWITMIPKEVGDVNSKLKLTTLEDTRYFHCNIKTLNLLPNVLAAERAKQLGCHETIFHRNGRVTECAHSNVHMIRDGVFVTPPSDNLILPGIARAHLMRACKALGYGVEERPFTLEELLAADEVIVTASGYLCNTACEVDGKAVGGRGGEMLKKMQDYVLDEFLQATNKD